ncbi:replication protein A 14 kDa subunit [Platysternon megacephalum]|uniref:Replication protein A 14 kDa subunit n=1 Tax=Platysternon megacephalum TaxID=55544 RepID=A0A4D9EMN2_9SAUR|nr:replication protein A 14 kDa subunit [Platysternon megacephalum]
MQHHTIDIGSLSTALSDTGLPIENWENTASVVDGPDSSTVVHIGVNYSSPCQLIPLCPNKIFPMEARSGTATCPPLGFVLWGGTAIIVAGAPFPVATLKVMH